MKYLIGFVAGVIFWWIMVWVNPLMMLLPICLIQSHCGS